MRVPLTYLLVALMLFSLSACALRPCCVKLDADEIEQLMAKEPERREPSKAYRLTVRGKIDYEESLGCHVIKEDARLAVIRVANQDSGILAELQKRGETLTFEGYFTISRDSFFIERIDGKDYADRRF
jgi:hypothetical protein